MTAPVSAIGASARHEPVVAVLSASQSAGQAGRVREAEVVEREKKTVEASSAQLSSAVAEINKSLQLASIGVRFEFDKEANKMVTKVVDVDSGEMIRQMPSEEVVHIAQAMNNLKGLLFAKAV